MRSSEKQLFIIQILSLIILLFNTIFYKFLGVFGVIVFLIALLFTLLMVCGIPRDNNITGTAIIYPDGNILYYDNNLLSPNYYRH